MFVLVAFPGLLVAYSAFRQALGARWRPKSFCPDALAIDQSPSGNRSFPAKYCCESR